MVMQIVAKLGNLPEIVNLMFGLVAILITYSVMLRTKNKLCCSVKYFLAGFITYSIVELVRIIALVNGVSIQSYLSVIIVILNFIFLAFLILGLRGIYCLVKSVNGELKLGEKLKLEKKEKKKKK